MSTHCIRKNGQVVGMITMADIFQFHGFTFEVSGHAYPLPIKLNKDWEESKRTGRTFWKAYEEWEKLSKEQKEKTRIAG